MINEGRHLCRECPIDDSVRGGAKMADYRLYCLDGVGHIGTGEWIEAASDDEALAMVRAKKLSVNCELWDRDRLVGRIPAHRVSA